MRHRTEHGEIPPTAGLPLHLGDLRGGRPALAEALAPLTGDPHALVTCSGTAALVCALTALSAHNDRRDVILPAYTCPLVAIAVIACGLRVHLCDTRASHFGMDTNALRGMLGRDTLAVVPAHLGGRLDDIATIRTAAHAVGAVVIEDAAQAMGARHADGTPAGMAGDIGIFSLAVGKGLSTFEGGLLASRDASLRAALHDAVSSTLPNHPGWEARRCLELLGYWALYRPVGLGLAYGRPLRRALRRGDAIGAVGDRFPMRVPLHRLGRWRRAVGTRAAARLPGFLAQTRDQAARRLPALRALPGVQVLQDTDGTHSTWPFFLLLLEDEQTRDAVLERLWTHGLGVSRLFIHALGDYPYLAPSIGTSNTPHARDFAARSLTVSNSLWLDDARFASIVHTLASR